MEGRAGFARRMLGAVMLGVGAIFGRKAKRDDHWSASPQVRIFDEESSEAPGAPPHPGDKG